MVWKHEELNQLNENGSVDGGAPDGIDMEAIRTEFSELPAHEIEGNPTQSQINQALYDDFVSNKELGEYAALFADTSDDSMMDAFLDEAIRAIEVHYNKIVIPRKTTDYFDCWDAYLELSQNKFPGDPNLTITWIGDEFPYTPTQLDKAVDDYVLDISGDNGRLIFKDVPRYTLSHLHENPIEVSYTPEFDTHIRQEARRAATWFVKESYRTERRPGGYINMMPFYKMLKPHKTVVR